MSQKNIRLCMMIVVLSVSSVFCTPPDTSDEYRFLCDMSRNGWELCNQNRVRYCHIDHFHTRQNCEQQGLECVELDDKTAVCLDKSKSCKENESKCENNIAYNCYQGFFSVVPCGTAKSCETPDKKAHCKPKAEECDGKGELHDGKCECNKGYKVDPNDDRNCIAE